MNLQHSKNIFANAIEEEMYDLIDKYVGKETEDSFPIVSKIGEVLIPMKNDIGYLAEYVESIENDDYDDSNDNDEEYTVELEQYYNISNNLKLNDILKIDATPELLKIFLMDIYKTKNKNIYGALIIKGDMRLNPLNPIIAKMITNGQIVIPDEFTLVVYEYKNTTKIECELESNNTSKIMSIVSEIEKNSYEAKGIITYDGDINVINAYAEKNNFENILFSFTVGDTARPKYCVTPTQFITQDVLMPYYGAIASRTDGEAYHSINLTPMLNGNVNLNLEEPNVDYADTCTGTDPNTIFRSLYNMNDINCNSLYSDHILKYDWKKWVYDCIMTSIYFLYEDDINKIIEEPEETAHEEYVPIISMDLSRNELYEMAQTIHLKGRAGMNKEELIEALTKIQGAENV